MAAGGVRAGGPLDETRPRDPRWPFWGVNRPTASWLALERAQ